MGIRSKLVLCLLAVMLPVVAVGVFASHLFDKQLAERVTATLTNTQRLESERIEQVLSEYARNARALASSYPLRDALSPPASRESFYSTSTPNDATLAISDTGASDENIIEQLSLSLQPIALSLQREAASLHSSIVELQIVDLLGQVVGQTDGFSWIPTDDQLISRAINTVRTQFGNAFVNFQNEQRLGTVSPIIGDNAMVVGVLIAEAQLQPIIGTVSKYETMGKTIEADIAQPMANGDAQFITPLRFERTAAFRKTADYASGLPIVEALHSPHTQVMRARDYRGVDSYFALKTIAGVGWGLAVKIDVSEAHAPVKELRRWLLLATLASLGFIVLIYTFLLVPIVGRLDKAAHAARHIMKGDLSARLIDNRQDEISELACSINSLANDLKADQQLRSQVESQLRYQALHDDLTGLFNRKYANTAIAQLSADATQKHSVMFLDLNGFKEVNDRFGHAAGDTVLKRIARRLLDNVSASATVARWGGDEFVVILPGADTQAATTLADVLHKNVFEHAVDSDKARHMISCSIGLATSSAGRALDQALIEADALMYEQKKQQRAQKTRNLLATQRLERAINEQRIEMRFQPIIRRHSGGQSVCVGADTSLFVRNKQGGHAISEKHIHKIITSTAQRELDNCYLTLALNALYRWNLASVIDDSFRLVVRLSDQSLNDAAFPALINKKLKRMDVQPCQLQIEASASTNCVDNLVIKTLQNGGVFAGIDASHCKPAVASQCLAARTTVCIDAYPAHAGEIATVKLHDLTRICDARQMDIMARGIDTSRKLAELQTLGVSRFQGDLFGPPLKAVEFIGCWTRASTANSQGHIRLTEQASIC